MSYKEEVKSRHAAVKVEEKYAWVGNDQSSEEELVIGWELREKYGKEYHLPKYFAKTENAKLNVNANASANASANVCVNTTANTTANMSANTSAYTRKLSRLHLQ